MVTIKSNNKYKGLAKRMKKIASFSVYSRLILLSGDFFLIKQFSMVFVALRAFHIDFLVRYNAQPANMPSHKRSIRITVLST